MNEKTKNILLGVLIVGIISMTVAYASLTQNLRINSSVKVQENSTSWNIHFKHLADTANEVKELVLTIEYVKKDTNQVLPSKNVTFSNITAGITYGQGNFNDLSSPAYVYLNQKTATNGEKLCAQFSHGTVCVKGITSSELQSQVSYPSNSEYIGDFKSCGKESTSYNAGECQLSVYIAQKVDKYVNYGIIKMYIKIR